MTTPWTRLFGNKKDRIPEHARITNLLSSVPIFEELNTRELQAIERILHRREYVQEEYIFRQGEPGMGMYIVNPLSGGGLAKLFSTHPPMEERIARLEAMAYGHPVA